MDKGFPVTEASPVKILRDIKASLEVLWSLGLEEKSGQGAEDAEGASGEAVANFPWLDQRSGVGRRARGAVLGAERHFLALAGLALLSEMRVTIWRRVRKGSLRGQGQLPEPNFSHLLLEHFLISPL